MKKLACLLVVVLLLGFRVVVGQQKNVEQEVIIGSVRTDGYEKITQGAFWQKRPEAKKIYEGETVPGFTSYKLNSNHFVRFADGEHNRNDINYIVFPKGELVYKDSSGTCFSAKCGNKIEFIRPVDQVKIIEKVVEKPVLSVIEVEKERLEPDPNLEPEPEPEPDLTPEPSTVNNYYVYGYTDRGEQMLYNNGGLYLYDSYRCSYRPVQWNLSLNWGCYPTYNDYCYGMNRQTVGGYYNSFNTTVVNNYNDNSYTDNSYRDNSVRDNDNYWNNYYPQPKPKPHPQPDNCGPVGVPGHDGGPTGTPGHDGEPTGAGGFPSDEGGPAGVEGDGNPTGAGGFEARNNDSRNGINESTGTKSASVENTSYTRRSTSTTGSRQSSGVQTKSATTNRSGVARSNGSTQNRSVVRNTTTKSANIGQSSRSISNFRSPNTVMRSSGNTAMRSQASSRSYGGGNFRSSGGSAPRSYSGGNRSGGSSSGRR